MNVVENEVKSLVFKELNNANKHFPLFNSSHQGYAVIKEEIEETMDALNMLLEVFADAWSGIKQNKAVFEQIRAVKACAVQVATESIQVAAMCDKFGMSLEGDGANHCLVCGEIIPEGIQVCRTCNEKNGVSYGV